MKHKTYYKNIRKNVFSLISDQTYTTALDIGCGYGGNIDYLLSKGLILSGVGIEPANLEFRNTQAKIINITIEDFLASGKESGKFDLILLLDVLEHLSEPEEILAKLSMLLNEKGAILISLPNVRNFRVFWSIFILGVFPRNKEGIFDGTHLRWFTKKTFLDIIRESDTYVCEKASDTGLEKGKKLYFANFLTLGLFRDFLTFQNVFLLRLK
ncbi:methyltransferase domain-containing protein [bacterium]|nr:methyltransferase domain-containing protein [bacterium]